MKYLFLPLAFLLFIAAKCDKNSTAIQLGESIELAPGQSASTDDLVLGFVSVESDSRCPKYTNCVRAGEAKITMIVNDPSAPVSMQIEADTKQTSSHTVGGYQVVLQALDPYPEAGKTTKPEDYRLKLMVKKAANK